MELAWIILIVAGLMEPCWVYTMERSEHFRNLGFTLATIVLLCVDLVILSVAMESIGTGVSYAVWAGIGAVVTFIMGCVVYHDKASPSRIMFAVFLIIGIVGLHLTTGGH